MKKILNTAGFIVCLPAAWISYKIIDWRRALRKRSPSVTKYNPYTDKW